MFDALNHHFRDQLRIYHLLKQEPILVDDGTYKCSQIVKDCSELIEKGLRTNELHGILSNKLVYNQASTKLKFKKIMFSEIMALRQLGKRPHVLTANIIAVNIDENQIILHQRSINSHLYPETLSIIGGGFCPQQETTTNDSFSLRSTALREFHEETQLDITMSSKTKLLLTEELSTGAIQVNFLGASVINMRRKEIINEEGQVKFITFNQLGELLEKCNETSWAPLGRGCVLAWLALGAPGTKEARFNGISATALYKKIIQ